MNKSIITILVDKNTIQEEINFIRKEFNQNYDNQDYKLNIIISGEQDFKTNLSDFLKFIAKK